MDYQCDFNRYVICTTKCCEFCGWNPKVAKARLEAFLERGVVIVERKDDTDSVDS